MKQIATLIAAAALAAVTTAANQLNVDFTENDTSFRLHITTDANKDLLINIDGIPISLAGTFAADFRYDILDTDPFGFGPNGFGFPTDPHNLTIGIHTVSTYFPGIGADPGEFISETYTVTLPLERLGISVPSTGVPDAGSTAGMLALGTIGLGAVARRKE